MEQLRRALWLLLGVCLVETQIVGAALLAVDLGGEHLTCVAIAPGANPISVVTNEMSKRKSPAVVTFKPPSGDRLLGEEAHAYGAKFPSSSVYFAKEAIGVPADAARSLLISRGVPVHVAHDSLRGTPRLLSSASGGASTAPVANYTAEEVVAMLLTYSKRIAEEHSQQLVTDIVVAVPAQFGQQQRKALNDASYLAGVNMLGIVNDHAAAALQYGIDRRELGMNSSKEVVFVDVGGSSTSAALVRYSSFGTSKQQQQRTPQFEVVAEAWEDTAGGADFDTAIAKHFAQEFENRYGANALSDERAFAKLKRQAKRTKEVLSANKDASINVEALSDGIDFASSITRDQFEALVDPIASRMARPLETVLQWANTSTNVPIEVVGGSSRVPIVQDKLYEAAGDRGEVGMHMNADEAVAWGAGLYAANLSTTFKVRNYGMLDAAPYAIEAVVDGGASDEGAEARSSLAAKSTLENIKAHTILPEFKRLPVRRKLTTRERHADFNVDLRIANTTSKLPRGHSSQHIRQYAIKGIQDAEARHNSTGEVHLHFAVDTRGIVMLPKAELVVTVLDKYKVAVNDSSAQTASSSASNASSTQNITYHAPGENMHRSEGDEEKEGDNHNKQQNDNSTTEEAQQDENANRSNASSGSNATSFEEREVVRRNLVQLQVEVASEYLPSLTAQSRKEAKDRLEKLDELDRRHERASKAKSQLENFVYKAKDALREDGEWHKVTTDETQTELLQQLEDVGDWAEMEGSDATAEEFERQLALLQSNTAPVQHRASELTRRPSAIDSAKADVQSLQEEVEQQWPTMLPQVNETERGELLEAINAMRSFIERSEATQAERGLTDDPAFNASDVEREQARLHAHVAKLRAKRPPPAPASEAAANTSNGSESFESNETVEASEATVHGQAEEEPYDEL